MSANTEIHPSITAFSWIAKKAMNALLYCLPKQQAAEAACRPVAYGILHTIQHAIQHTHGCVSVQAALVCRPQCTIHHCPLTTHYSLFTGCFSVQAASASRPQFIIHHSHFTIHNSPLTRLFQRYKAFQLKNRLPVIALCGKALCLLKTQFAKKPKNPV